jgi:hypothetical protein
VIPQARIGATLAKVRSAVEAKRVSTGMLLSIVGSIVSLSLPPGIIILPPIYAAIHTVWLWEDEVVVEDSLREELMFWLWNLPTLPRQALIVVSSPAPVADLVRCQQRC